MSNKKIAPDKVALVEEILSLKEQKRLRWKDIYKGFTNNYLNKSSFIHAVSTGRAPFLPELIEYLKQLDGEELKNMHVRYKRCKCFEDNSYVEGDRISRVYEVEDHKLILKEEKWV